MECFTISVDLTDKVCTIKGSQIGLTFLDQQKDLTEKFIQFCSEKYGHGIDSDIKWQVISGGLRTEEVLPCQDIQLALNSPNTLELAPEIQNVDVNNETGVNCSTNKYFCKRRSKYRSQKLMKSENGSRSEWESKFEIESSEMVEHSEGLDNEGDKVLSAQNRNGSIEERSLACLKKGQTRKMQLRDKGSQSGDKRSSCTVCNTSFSTNAVLHHHIKQMHKTHTFCVLCQSVCKSKSDYKEHMLECNNRRDTDQIFICTKCGISFNNIRSMYKHNTFVHRVKLSICRFCGECFKTRKDLSHHVEDQHKTSFICKICKQVFIERKDFDHHLENTECAISCSHCSSVFSTKQDLQEHRKEHLSCEKCGKVFKLKVVLDRHMATHSSDRPFQCETCGVCFKLPSTLNLHRRTHLMTNTFKCTSCDKQFRSADGIKNHKIKYHMTEEELASYKKKVYTCEHCGKMTGQKHAHIRHVRSHTGEKPYVCNDCNKSFPTLSALNIHRKKHDGKMDKCDICKLNFWEYSKYTRHLKSKKHKALAARIKSLKSTSSLQDSVTDVVGQSSVVVINDDNAENIANKTSSTYIILPDHFQNIQVGNLEIVGNEVEAVYTVDGDSVIVQTEGTQLC